MSRRRVVAATEAYEPAVVDLWDADGGAMFETVELVRSRAKLFDEKYEKAEAVDANEEADSDDAVKLLVELFDILLKPVGHRRKASTIIVERYEADKVSLTRIEDLIGEIADAGRPT